MVLAVQAAEIAARTGNGEARGARVEVVEWLLLHRVDGQRTGLAVHLAHQHPVVVAAAAADAPPALGYAAMMRT